MVSTRRRRLAAETPESPEATPNGQDKETTTPQRGGPSFKGTPRKIEKEMTTPKRSRSPTRQSRSKSPTPKRERSKSPTRQSRSKSPPKQSPDKSPAAKKTKDSMETAKEPVNASEVKEIEQQSTVSDLPVIQESKPDERDTEAAKAEKNQSPSPKKSSPGRSKASSKTPVESKEVPMEEEKGGDNSIKSGGSPSPIKPFLKIAEYKKEQQEEKETPNSRKSKRKNNNKKNGSTKTSGSPSPNKPSGTVSETTECKDDVPMEEEHEADKDTDKKTDGKLGKSKTPQKQEETPGASSAQEDEAAFVEKSTKPLQRLPKITTLVGKTTTTKRKKKKAPRNELTSFIPGYTAKLQLDSSSLDSQRPGLDALRKRALVTDKTTAGFVKGTLANQKRTEAVVATQQHKTTMTWSSTKDGKVVKSSFKLGTKRDAPNHAGDQWFGMVPTPMTEDVKRDLKVIRYRNYLDPKRFYKSADTTSKFVQVGTVVEGTAEFYSSRLTKKERRANLTEELMADHATADYTKRKHTSMQQAKGQQSRKRQKQTSSKKRGKRFHA
ncbi:Deoxynucleotidyltransferase terminal-interacting protein 2 [Seminavis robusta]|uniref:Deoxynucleotidyltransferase terminal-interacting protein 2 n=1 Tax=Seminavis robusta TaxID=568900 RepID=A0A9N8HHJ2_9STRA|nr:Deoxynucleotidyltransferase terminal-interacting protein 2 [Seminavis robusta]|eukprot:Sro565_g167680.1 Deoxynucleotidyltransferase terminal-interacting protein 2 (551) ;mRNA; r:50653-52305